MNKFSPSAFLRGRFPLAIVAGLLLAASFPKFSIAGFAWIAPGLMLAATLGKRSAQAWRIGYVAGLAHYLASLSWLLNIPVTGFPILGWIALAAFLALFPATWVWLSLKISGLAPGKNWAEALREISGLSWPERISWTLRSAAIWVALEWVLAHIFGGFPWNLLGDSQYTIVPLIQFASFTGVYGVSFLVAWTSVSLLCAAASILGKPGQRSPWMVEIILPFTAGIAAFIFGFHQLSQPPTPARELKVALVQPGIPQTLIWNPTNDFARFQDLLHLTRDAMTNSPDLVVWPEAALPGLPRYEPDFAQPISDLAREHKAWMIIGADDAEVTRTDTNYYNASFLISPDGRLVNTYWKRALVIFGEYIPLEKWLPFIKWFTPITGSYTAGKEAVQFRLRPGSTVPQETDSEPKPPGTFQTSVLICFEDVFPRMGRKSVKPDTDFLVNITNDGWFGKGAAQWQQAAAATFRTIENGVPLIRCANTGLTCWIDAHGRWMDKFTDDQGTVYGAGFLLTTVYVPETHPQTFYNLHGNWFAWLCMALALISVIPSLIHAKRNLPTADPPATP